MNSITIHGLDDHLKARIKSRAEKEGLSLNKTVKKMLEESLGMRPRSDGRHRGAFQDFCGVWSVEDLAEFERQTEDLRQVDEEDWR